MRISANGVGVTQRRTAQLKWQTALSRLCRDSLCFILCLTVAILPLPHVTPAALAQSYAQGYDRYTRGDFKGAETSLQQALSRTSGSAAKAKVYKLLGIVQYMTGKKSNAEQSFETAVSLDPSTTVGNDEVLDESVVPFFNAAKAKVKSAPQAKAARAAPQAKAPPRPPAAPRYGKPTKATSLTVASNAKRRRS